MKKKTVFIVCGALLVAVILCVCLYVGIRSNQMKNEMWDYLKANNYAETEIKSVDVKHSFMNALLSYNEWTVDVVFEDEPTSAVHSLYDKRAFINECFTSTLYISVSA